MKRSYRANEIKWVRRVLGGKKREGLSGVRERGYKVRGIEKILRIIEDITWVSEVYGRTLM